MINSELEHNVNEQPLVNEANNPPQIQPEPVILVNNVVDLLNPHGTKWENLDEEVQDDVLKPNLNIRAQLKWSRIQYFTKEPREIDEFDFFLLLFPIRYLNETILKLTNTKLQAAHATETSKGEILKFLGIIIAMCLQPMKGGIRAYWDEADADSCLMSMDYGVRFKMKRTRFEALRNSLTLAAPDPTEPTDPWGAIRGFINAFNLNRRSSVTPGEFLTIDECMCFWLGQNSIYNSKGMPHITKIIRKPRGVGAEFKAICCSETGILLGLELMEGKTRQQAKAYHHLYGEGTSVVLRLCTPYNTLPRTVVADSYFSSVKTAIALHEHLNLRFMGIVKTATRNYPMAYMKKWYDEGSVIVNNERTRERGSHVILKVIHNNNHVTYHYLDNN